MTRSFAGLEVWSWRELHAVKEIIKSMSGIQITLGQRMGVGAQRDRWVAVPHAVSDRHNINIVRQQQGGVRMPLWYIKDKPGKP